MSFEDGKIGCAIAVEILGTRGRMIWPSRTDFLRHWESHAAVFNASVFAGPTRIWAGDLDLTEDEELLTRLAQRLGHTVYVLAEKDRKLDGRPRRILASALFVFKPDGTSHVGSAGQGMFVRGADCLFHRRSTEGTR